MKKPTKREKLWAAYRLARTRDAVLEAKYTAQGYMLVAESQKIDRLATVLGKQIEALGWAASANAESFKREIQALGELNEARVARKSAHA